MKKKLKKSIKKFLIILIFIFAISFLGTKTYARYISNASDEDEIRVAKFGKLTLVEKLDGVVQENNLDTISIVDSNFTLGDAINKEVYIEFIDSEVSTYIFLVIDSINWKYDDLLKEFKVENNNTKLLSFNLDSSWNYLKSSDNKHIFYYEFDVNTDKTTKFDVMNQINTGIIGYYDIEFVNDSQIKFNAYNIQKDDTLNVEEAWDYLNIE